MLSLPKLFSGSITINITYHASLEDNDSIDDFRRFLTFCYVIAMNECFKNFVLFFMSNMGVQLIHTCRHSTYTRINMVN